MRVNFGSNVPILKKQETTEKVKFGATNFSKPANKLSYLDIPKLAFSGNIIRTGDDEKTKLTTLGNIPIMAAATNTPISVMETAGEGGAWGISLLASYMINKQKNQSLSEFLNKNIFSNKESSIINPAQSDVVGFNKFFDRYSKGLAIERAAVNNLK